MQATTRSSLRQYVAANRTQFDRIFFGELDTTWVTYGFYVCKFYQDDPMSDDDWKVNLTALCICTHLTCMIDDEMLCDAHPDQPLPPNPTLHPGGACR